MRRHLGIATAAAGVLLAVGVASASAALSSKADNGPAAEPGAGEVVDSAVDSTTPASTTIAVPLNEVGDAGAEAGWSSTGSSAGTVLWRDGTRSHTGLFSFALTAGSAGGDVVLDDSPDWVPASPGPTCAASAWVAGEAGVTVNLRLAQPAVATPEGSTTTTFVLPDAEWHLLDAVLAVTPGNDIDLTVGGVGLAPGATLWVDDITENCGEVTPPSPPVAALVVTPVAGIVPLIVDADASASSAGTSEIVGYGFDWGDGTPTTSSATPAASHTYTGAGNFAVTVTVTDTAGASATATSSVEVADPVVVAAGDISCVGGAISAGCGASRTAALIARIAPTRVLPLGDLQYGGTRTAAEFQASYGPFPDPVAHPSWGDFKAITSPTIGSHEYDGYPTADGYFAYWNGSPTATGPAGRPDEGFYAEDIGTWRVIHVNSQKGYKAGGAEDLWLAGELAAHAAQCTLVTWHHPRFSSGVHGNQLRTAGLFATAYAGGADVLLSGNDHLYERFAPQDPSATADPARGIAQFVVGAGGKGLYQWGKVQPNSVFRNNTTFGVLSLTLHPGGYDWAYIGVDDKTLDSGTSACHS